MDVIFLFGASTSTVVVVVVLVAIKFECTGWRDLVLAAYKYKYIYIYIFEVAARASNHLEWRAAESSLLECNKWMAALYKRLQLKLSQMSTRHTYVINRYMRRKI